MGILNYFLTFDTINIMQLWILTMKINCRHFIYYLNAYFVDSCFTES